MDLLIADMEKLEANVDIKISSLHNYSWLSSEHQLYFNFAGSITGFIILSMLMEEPIIMPRVV